MTYSGEGTLRIAGMADVPLPPAYERRRGTVTVTVPEGRRSFALDYRFDDGLRTIEEHGLPPSRRGPYPACAWRRARRRCGTIDSPLVWRALGGFVDLTIIAILGTIVWCCICGCFMPRRRAFRRARARA